MNCVHAKTEINVVAAQTKIKECFGHWSTGTEEKLTMQGRNDTGRLCKSW
jgi:hypothetical protein